MRVLVIDDDEALRRVVRRMLEPDGHDVVEAEDGRAGLARFTRGDFDAVITDILMPEQEGVQTIMQIRASNAQVRIIAVSGGGSLKIMDFLEMARLLGADATLPKPFRKEELIACLTGASRGRTDVD